MQLNGFQRNYKRLLVCNIYESAKQFSFLVQNKNTENHFALFSIRYVKLKCLFVTFLIKSRRNKQKKLLPLK